MSQQPQQPQSTTSHFDAAKVIVETLQGLDKLSQAPPCDSPARPSDYNRRPSAPTPATLVTSSPASAAPSAAGVPTQSTDIKQFAAAKAPKSDQQFAAVVAYFYRFEAPETQRKDTIDAETLLEAAACRTKIAPQMLALRSTTRRTRVTSTMPALGNIDLTRLAKTSLQ